MLIYKNIEEIPFNTNRSVTVGAFDGVHIGHLEIIKMLKNSAKKNNSKTMIITFEPHPQFFFNNSVFFNNPAKEKIKLLTTIDERLEIFDLLGIDEVFVVKFDAEFANIEAKNFIVNYLLKKIGFNCFTVGYNHGFGKNREGNFALLQKIQSENNNSNSNENNENEKLFSVFEVPQFVKNNIKISSTNIRKTLKEGTVEAANELLGRNYFVTGKVCKGSQIGTKIGFPTANIEVSKDKLLPQNGVYFCKIQVFEKRYFGIANLGYRPTVAGLTAKSIPILEVNIFDFSENIYDLNVTVAFIKFVREEKKFENLNELKKQINNDISYCHKLSAQLSAEKYF